MGPIFPTTLKNSNSFKVNRIPNHLLLHL